MYAIRSYYALMKISAYYKNQGDKVEWWNALDNHKYDIVYSSKVFDFTPENPFLPECTIKGGVITSYSIHYTKLYEYMLLYSGLVHSLLHIIFLVYQAVMV